MFEDATAGMHACIFCFPKPAAALNLKNIYQKKKKNDNFSPTLTHPSRLKVFLSLSKRVIACHVVLLLIFPFHYPFTAPEQVGVKQKKFKVNQNKLKLQSHQLASLTLEQLHTPADAPFAVHESRKAQVLEVLNCFICHNNPSALANVYYALYVSAS